MLKITLLSVGVLALGLIASERASFGQERTEMRSAGVGGGISESRGQTQGSFAAQAQAVEISNDPDGDGKGTDPQVYAAGQLGAEVGTAGFALDGSTHVGKNYWARKPGKSIVPVFGLEPLNFQFATSIGFDKREGQSGLHGILGRESLFEWSPMASFGVQFFGDTCKAMAILRGGGSIGTLGDNDGNSVGVRPVYGAGAMAVCRDIFLFNADLTRIKTGGADVDQASLSAAVKIPGQIFTIGTVVDTRDTKDVATSAPIISLPLPGAANGEARARAVIGGEF